MSAVFSTVLHRENYIIPISLTYFLDTDIFLCHFQSNLGWVWSCQVQINETVRCLMFGLSKINVDRE